MATRKDVSAKRGASEPLPVRRRWTTPAQFASPFALMQDMTTEMDRLLQGFGWGRERGATEIERTGWVPQIDVFREGENLVVRADLPGLSRDDVTLDVTDDVLTIRGERREEKTQEEEGYYWHERRQGSFVRTIPLPEGAAADQAKARFENGVLEVTVPAPEREEPRSRRIEIK